MTPIILSPVEHSYSIIDSRYFSSLQAIYNTTVSTGGLQSLQWYLFNRNSRTLKADHRRTDSVVALRTVAQEATELSSRAIFLALRRSELERGSPGFVTLS